MSSLAQPSTEVKVVPIFISDIYTKPYLCLLVELKTYIKLDALQTSYISQHLRTLAQPSSQLQIRSKQVEVEG